MEVASLQEVKNSQPDHVQTFSTSLHSPLPQLPVVSGQEEAGGESVPLLAHADVELLSAVVLFGRREGEMAA